MSEQTTGSGRSKKKLSVLDRARDEHRNQAINPEAPPWTASLTKDGDTLAAILLRFFNGEISKTEAADALELVFFPAEEDNDE